MKLFRALVGRRRPIPFEPFRNRPRLGLSELEVASSQRLTRHVIGVPLDHHRELHENALRATGIAGGLDPQRSDLCG